MSKVDFEIARTHHLSKFSRYLTEIVSREEVKALNKNRKTDKSNNIAILNRCVYISKLSPILEDTSKFKRVNIEEEKSFESVD